jgi:hypothetical protein
MRLRPGSGNSSQPVPSETYTFRTITKTYQTTVTASRIFFLISRESLYTSTGEEYASHKTTKHSAKEYVRDEVREVIHSNTIENVFSVFKRGMVGVYQHCGEAHLHRYLAEFDFRYNRRAALKVSDTERHDQLLAMIEGERLTYRRIGETGNA